MIAGDLPECPRTVRRVHTVEIRVVPRIKEVSTQQDLDTLFDLENLEHCHVPVVQARPADGPSRGVAKVPEGHSSKGLSIEPLIHGLWTAHRTASDSIRATR